jgi:sugar (pentulose or hexulose) kinase
VQLLFRLVHLNSIWDHGSNELLNKPAGFIGVDVGTTHCKASLFVEQGERLHLAATSIQPSGARRDPAGFSYYDPDALFDSVAACIADLLGKTKTQHTFGVGIASMAESGLLVDAENGNHLSPVLPWFDQAAAPQADALGHHGNIEHRRKRFLHAGIYPSFKCSLAKILWWREEQKMSLDGLVWLPVASYIAFRLSGQMACEPSLAGRTYAFDINRQIWDEAWLQEWSLTTKNFPPILEAGELVGGCLGDNQAGLPPGTPVCLAGHDHVCAAFAVGAIRPGLAFDSMGTAESFLGAYEEHELGEVEFRSGLSYGCHVVAGRKYWMGGLSASGGSLEWLRELLSEPPLSYDDLDDLVGQAGEEPSRILFFPYLSGSGSPHSDPHARGAFVGLRATHQRADLVKAVLEGTAYEMEFIRQAAEQVTGARIERVLAAGGGTRNRRWMQIKADISGCVVEALSMREVVTLGAALLSALACGEYASQTDALLARPELKGDRFYPNMIKHKHYQDIYHQGFLPLQQPLRELSRQSSRLGDVSG